MHYLPEEYLIYKILEDWTPWFNEQIIFYTLYQLYQYSSKIGRTNYRLLLTLQTCKRPVFSIITEMIVEKITWFPILWTTMINSIIEV